jgi:hypothetical protein
LRIRRKQRIRLSGKPLSGTTCGLRKQVPEIFSYETLSAL